VSELKSTRSRLLDSAPEEFLARGYEGASGESIRKSAGVSQGSWTHAFPRQKAQAAAEVYVLIHEHMWADCLAKISRQTAGRAVVWVEQALQALCASFEAAPARVRLLLELEHALSRTAEQDAVRKCRTSVADVLASRHQASRSGLTRTLTGGFLYAAIFGPTLVSAYDFSVEPGSFSLLDLCHDYAQSAAIIFDQAAPKTRSQTGALF
jgi:AcrR family transcriptional regulator